MVTCTCVLHIDPACAYFRRAVVCSRRIRSGGHDMANITVIGGTGYAGSAIVKEAISRGHRVTAVSRSSPGAPIEGVTYVTSSAQGNGAAIEGADVVVAALSPRGDNLGKLPAIYRQLAEEASRIDARFVVIGGFSSLRPAAGA